MEYKKYYNLNRPILLIGETGTGKSTLARKLHFESENSHRPFVEVNIASLKPEIFESEIFGHRKGAFTGAISDRQGFVEEAQSGTLFLDEIGDLGMDLQKKILSLMEDGSYYSLGSVQKKYFKGRIITATNKDLNEMKIKQEIREDFFYRLNVHTLMVSPIRHCKKLLKKNIEYFIQEHKVKFKKEGLEIQQDCWDYLINYGWPGNYRELKNCLEYMVFNCESNHLTLKNIPIWLKGRGNIENIDYLNNFEQDKRIFEKKYLTRALESTSGHINKACAQYGICKSTLLYKIKEYDINIWKIKSNNSTRTFI